MSIYTQLAESKPTLLSAIIISIIGILVLPIILPNLFHGTHTIHIFLHTGGLIAAVFLTMASAFAYLKMKTRELFLTSIAFSFFIAAETVSLIDITWPYVFYLGQLSLREVEHVLIISMLGMFSLAVFRND